MFSPSALQRSADPGSSLRLCPRPPRASPSAGGTISEPRGPKAEAQHRQRVPPPRRLSPPLPAPAPWTCQDFRGGCSLPDPFLPPGLEAFLDPEGWEAAVRGARRRRDPGKGVSGDAIASLIVKSCASARRLCRALFGEWAFSAPAPAPHPAGAAHAADRAPSLFLVRKGSTSRVRFPQKSTFLSFFLHSGDRLLVPQPLVGCIGGW